MVPTDIEGNDHDFMSVEFHYYKPFEYCGGTPASEGGVYYWGQAYSKYGKTSDSKESAMYEGNVHNMDSLLESHHAMADAL